MKKTLKIVPPKMPDFYSYELPPGKKQDGPDFSNSHPIRNFSKVEAEEFGEYMKTTFMEHWKFKNSGK